MRKGGVVMETQFRLRYKTLDEKENFVSVQVIPYNKSKRQLFQSVENAEPRFFIKCPLADSAMRDEASLSADRAVSPFLVTRFGSGVIPEAELQCCDDGENWRTFERKILLYEHWPMNLRQFWIEREQRGNEEELEIFRRQTILKLLEGIVDLHIPILFHRDIKPDNIMLREGGPEEGLALTDFDAAYDGTQPQDFNAGTVPYWPNWDNVSVSRDAWRDLYAVCMVALWLYEHTNTQYLYCLSSGAKPESEEDILRILSESGGQFPDDFLDKIVPTILESVKGLARRNPAPNSKTRETELERQCAAKLWNALKSLWPATNLKELLKPAAKPAKWCAVLKVDQDYRPLFGIGREYRILPIIESASNADTRTIRPVSAGNGISYCYDAQERNANPKNLLPPEIYLTCIIPPDERPYLEAGIYAQQHGETQLVTRIRDFAGKEGLTLYPNENRLFSSSVLQEVRIEYSCIYAPGERIPERLGLWRGSPPSLYAHDPAPDANVNIVFFMMDQWKGGANFPRSPGKALLQQIYTRLSKESECSPRYYGATIYNNKLLSFCDGRTDISESQLLTQYSRAFMGGKGSCPWQYVEDRRRPFRALSHDIPTVVIGFLSHPVDSWEVIEDILREGEENGIGLRYAVDYLQLFFTQDCLPEKLFSWLPHLDAMVRPEGSCFVTPLERANEALPDISQRWFPVILSQCRQRPRLKER